LRPCNPIRLVPRPAAPTSIVGRSQSLGGVVVGEIDLDPATHPIAQETVAALDYFTAAENGLA
jgi:hypothetical protein